MLQQKILIKGMVCDRCILTVKNELQKAGVEVAHVYLGEATIIHRDTVSDLRFIDERLQTLGFSLIENKKEKIVKQVKQLVEEVYSGNFDFPHHFLFSNLLTSRINKDYNSISATFSVSQKITIEKYFLDYRIERIKEFLIYTDLTRSDISFKLGFSSVAHLSRQFKTYTGLNPSHFKNIKAESSTTIEKKSL
jgi:AraC-like DNA-binding protein